MLGQKELIKGPAKASFHSSVELNSILNRAFESASEFSNILKLGFRNPSSDHGKLIISRFFLNLVWFLFEA